MACAVSITRVEGVRDPGGRLTGIRIQGAGRECRRVEVRTSCAERHTGGLLEDSRLVDLRSDGSFDVLVPTVPTLSCASCRSPITVIVQCVIEGDIYHPECEAAILTQPLWCTDDRCPIVTASAVVSPDCNRDRTRTVSFHVRVTAPPGWLVESRLEPGDGTSFLPTTARDYLLLHRFDASRSSTVVPRVHVESPPGCPPIELPPVNIPFCAEPSPEEPPTGPVCPHVHPSVTAVSVAPTPRGCRVQWIAHTTPPAAPGMFAWQFDSEPPEPPDGRWVRERNYTSSGLKRVTVDFVPARHGCPSSHAVGSTVVENCEAPAGSGEKFSCLVARAAAVAALALGLALLAVSFCITDPSQAALANAARIAGGISLAAGVIVFLLWLILCAERPCKSWLLMLGLAFIGAGVALLHLSGCCPIFAIIGLASVALGVALMLAWRSACDMTWCAFASELALFNAVTLAFVMVAIALALGGSCLPDLLGLIGGEPPGILEIIGAVSAALVDLGWVAVTLYAVGCGFRFGEVQDRTPPGLREPEMSSVPGP